MSRAQLWPLLLWSLAGCLHLSERGTHATARLAELALERHGDGTDALSARYVVEGMRSANWVPAEARLTVILEDVPFAAVEAVPTDLHREQLAVQVALEGRLPPAVASRVQRAQPVRVRLRGELVLAVGRERLAIPIDDEVAVGVGRAGP